MIHSVCNPWSWLCVLFFRLPWGRQMWFWRWDPVLVTWQWNCWKKPRRWGSELQTRVHKKVIRWRYLGGVWLCSKMMGLKALCWSQVITTASISMSLLPMSFWSILSTLHAVLDNLAFVQLCPARVCHSHSPFMTLVFSDKKVIKRLLSLNGKLCICRWWPVSWTAD